jgi:hypothetical protein
VREGKERDDALPVGHPGFANCGILLVPRLGKVDQLLFCLSFGAGGVNQS